MVCPWTDIGISTSDLHAEDLLIENTSKKEKSQMWNKVDAVKEEAGYRDMVKHIIMIIIISHGEDRSRPPKASVSEK